MEAATAGLKLSGCRSSTSLLLPLRLIVMSGERTLRRKECRFGFQAKYDYDVRNQQGYELWRELLWEGLG